MTSSSQPSRPRKHAGVVFLERLIELNEQSRARATTERAISMYDRLLARRKAALVEFLAKLEASRR